METEGLNFGQALESLAERYRVHARARDRGPARRREARSGASGCYALLERTAAYYVRVLWESPEAADAREYLAERGLEEDALRAYRVGFAPDTWDRVVNGSRRAGYTDERAARGGAGHPRSGGSVSSIASAGGSRSRWPTSAGACSGSARGR